MCTFIKFLPFIKPGITDPHTLHGLRNKNTDARYAVVLCCCDANELNLYNFILLSLRTEPISLIFSAQALCIRNFQNVRNI